MDNTNNITILPAAKIRGQISLPGDKSISHRAIMFASLADGRSVINNFLAAEDCLSTINAFRAMGVAIDQDGSTAVVEGVGVHGLRAPRTFLDLGNSGTTMRLLAGVLAGQQFDTVLSGDESLQSRPMKRIIDPLAKMKAHIRGTGKRETAPLYITGSPLEAIEFAEDKGSAQVKSCILLAGMYAQGETVVIENRPSRDHTERMLYLFGAPFINDKKRLRIRPTKKLRSQQITVPGDISSAAFFIVAATILEDSEITITDVGLNQSRCGIIHILKDMGANIEIIEKPHQVEPRGTIIVKSAQLHGINLSAERVPSVIDELPVLMVAAACAEGDTTIVGAQELRVKETDRIRSMCKGLSALGVAITEKKDGVYIAGRCAHIKGNVSVNSYHDHRTAMSLAIAALRADGEVRITNADCVSISFPQFFEQLQELTG